jgi:hypothetical protein
MTEGVNRTVRFCGIVSLMPAPPSSEPSEPFSSSPLTHAFFNLLPPFPILVGVTCSSYPKSLVPRVRSSVPGVATVLQLPGLLTSSVTPTPGRGGVFGWNSRGASLARAMSVKSICGGGEVRLGETLPVGGEDGGDCLPAAGALPLCGKVDEGGDELRRFDGGEPAVASTSKVDSGSMPEPAGPGIGFRPSRKAFAISAAFHFEYLIFSSDYHDNSK